MMLRVEPWLNLVWRARPSSHRSCAKEEGLAKVTFDYLSDSDKYNLIGRQKSITNSSGFMQTCTHFHITCTTVDFTSLRTARIYPWECGARASLSIHTETRRKDSSRLLLQLLWVCVAINYFMLLPRSHAQFHDVRSKVKSTVVLVRKRGLARSRDTQLLTVGSQTI